MRSGRRRYYDMFSRCYDRFVALHSGRDEQNSRNFLVDCAQLEGVTKPRILDICCGTGAAIFTFASKYPGSTPVGLDFSRGMLRRASEKDSAQVVNFIEGDAAWLPFSSDAFDVVSCSHAFYELKGEARTRALMEMKRVVKPGGSVLIMEHEMPRHPLTRFLFSIRMSLVGSAGVKMFLRAGLEPFQRLFPEVRLFLSPSGKSRLFCCIK
jgi:ubiquinone/menaquinone biosynthesis C-methylase UbiE